MGNVGTLGDLLAFCTSFFIGYGLDLFGRKKLSILFLLMAGTATLCTPIPENLTWLYFFTGITLIGFIPLSKSPYFIDYFEPQSLGRAFSIMEFVAICGTILSTTVALQVEKNFGAAPVYYGIGTIVYLVSVVLCIGLSDIEQKPKEDKTTRESTMSPRMTDGSFADGNVNKSGSFVEGNVNNSKPGTNNPSFANTREASKGNSPEGTEGNVSTDEN